MLSGGIYRWETAKVGTRRERIIILELIKKGCMHSIRRNKEEKENSALDEE
jgi:hypothetical protein